MMTFENVNELPLGNHTGDPIYLRGAQLAHSHERVLAVLHVLTWDALRIAPSAALLEIGCASGGSALAFFSVRQQFLAGPLVTVDPWGNRPYPASGSRYGRKHETEAVAQLAASARDSGVLWFHWRVSSLDYFTAIEPLGYWESGERHEYKYALAFLDGEHVFSTVEMEIRAVAARLVEGGWIVVDNANHAQLTGCADMIGDLAALSQKLGLRCKFYNVPDGDVIAVLGKRDPSDVLGHK